MLTGVWSPSGSGSSGDWAAPALARSGGAAWDRRTRLGRWATDITAMLARGSEPPFHVCGGRPSASDRRSAMEHQPDSDQELRAGLDPGRWHLWGDRLPRGQRAVGRLGRAAPCLHRRRGPVAGSSCRGGSRRPLGPPAVTGPGRRRAPATGGPIRPPPRASAARRGQAQAARRTPRASPGWTARRTPRARVAVVRTRSSPRRPRGRRRRAALATTSDRRRLP